MKAEKIKKPLLLVKWFDTYSNDRWRDINEAKEWGSERLIIHSVGWLIDESKDHILLAGGIQDDEDMAHLFIHIPKANIIHKIKIKL